MMTNLYAVMEDNKKNGTQYVDGMCAAERTLKRLIDLVGSFILLLIFSPFIAIIAIALLMQHDGSPIFKQERIGYGGKPFNIYKFRSMKMNAEKNEVPMLAEKEDPRLTKVGKFLRVHHLDEIPQLWNVFVGDMSFVGPRPEREYFIHEIMKHNPDYPVLYRMRPGVTSRATIYNGYTNTMEKMLTRLDMDLRYYRERSLLLDFKLLGLTFLKIVLGSKF